MYITEEKFFETFEIKRKEYVAPGREYDDNGELTAFYIEKEEYPEITDRILLKIICLINKEGRAYGAAFFSETVNDLKDEVLSDCRALLMDEGDSFKKAIQDIFKEEE